MTTLTPERIEELLPCPFCGSDAFIIGPVDGLYRAQCKSCGTSVGEFKTRKECAPFWNRRALSRGMREALVKAREALKASRVVAKGCMSNKWTTESARVTFKEWDAACQAVDNALAEIDAALSDAPRQKVEGHMRTDCPVHKQTLPCQPCAETDKARTELGLPLDRFADVGGGIGPGCRIACRCIHCQKLFVSRSHNLADVESVCRGDCGCTTSAAMTTPNDAPRPTSELTKELRGATSWDTSPATRDALLLEAAASLQALEARNKELEGGDAAILSAYRGIMVLRTMCRKAGLKMGKERSEQLLVELDAAFPGLAARSALRAALHPATKTGET